MTRRAGFSARRKAHASFRADCSPETLNALLRANAEIKPIERGAYNNEEMWREYRAKQEAEGIALDGAEKINKNIRTQK